MFEVPIVLLAALIGVTTPDSPSATKCLGTTKSVAFSLRADAAKLNQSAGGLTSAYRIRMDRDIADAETAVRELWEMDRIASPRQHAVITRVAPLLRDLARNLEDMSEHARAAGRYHARHDSMREYLAGHEEIANRLAALIAETIDAARTAPVRPPDERE
jgi:hypothetical protein